MAIEKYYVLKFKHDPRYGLIVHSKPTGDIHFSGHSAVRMCRLDIGADDYTISKGMTQEEAEAVLSNMKKIVFPCDASQNRSNLFHEDMTKRVKSGEMKGFDAAWIEEWNDNHPFTKFEHDLYMAAYNNKETPTINWLIDWLNEYEEKYKLELA